MKTLLKLAVTLAVLMVLVAVSAVSVHAQAPPAQHSYAALDEPNNFTATNAFSLGLYTGPLSFAQITALSFVNPGTIITCTNCTTSSDPCTIGSSQVVAIYLNGVWNCGGFGGGGGGASITVNNGGTLGTPVNFQNGTSGNAINFLNPSGSNIQATINNASVTNVMLANNTVMINTASGSGLSGGGTVALGSSLSLSFLPGCTTNQVPLWNGSAWTCFNGGTGTVTTSATGTTGILPVWTGGSVLGNSSLTDNGTIVATTENIQAPVHVSTVAIGTPPFTVTSTTPVTNLSIGGNAATATNASQLLTATWAAPLAIGTGTPAAGIFTTLTATGTATLGITGATQCLQVNTSGVVAGTGSACGAGGGGNVTGSALTTGLPVLGSGGSAITVGAINIAGGSSFITGLLPTANGGTGISTAASVGVPQISSGHVWSVSTTLPSGLSATNLTLTTPSLGAATAASINGTTIPASVTLAYLGATAQAFTNGLSAPTFTSTVTTGTAPFTVTSTTAVANLSIGGNAATSTNASQLLSGTWAVPGTIGSTTPNTGAFTTLSASSTVTLAITGATQCLQVNSAGTVAGTGTACGAGGGGGNVSGPGSSTLNDIVLFNNTSGTLLSDAGFGFPLSATHIGTLSAGSNGLVASATTDTTNASNISSGTLAGARMAATNLATTGNGGVTGQLPISAVGSAGLSGSSPIVINSAGAISCPSCGTGTGNVTAGGALTNNAVVVGQGSEALATISADTNTTHALFATAGAPGFRAIATSDLPTAIPIANVGSAGLSGTIPVTITSAGAIACATCVTSAASLTSTALMTGAGLQASQTPSATATLDTSGDMSLPGTLAVTGHVTLEGVTSTGATGTGAFVFAISPTVSGATLNGTTTLAITGSTQCLHVNTSGVISGTGVDCGGGGGGGVNGPSTTTVGDIVLWNNTTGTLASDAGFGYPLANANLANSSITLNGTANEISSPGVTSLGGTATFAITNPFIFPGKATFAASTTSAASFTLPTGTAPTSPASGNVWNASGIVKFFDGTNTNSFTTIQSAPTSLQLAEFSGTTGLLTTTGILTANVTTQTSNGAANEVCTYTAANKVCVPGSVSNAMLTNSTITVTAGAGLTGGGSVALGGSVTLTSSFAPVITSPASTQVFEYNGSNWVNAYAGINVDAQTTDYTFICPTDRLGEIEFNITTARGFYLPQAGSTACTGSNMGMVVRNTSTSTAALTVCSGTGSAGGCTAGSSTFNPENTNSINLVPGAALFIYSDNTNYHDIPIATPFGGVNVKTTNYTLTLLDKDKVVVMNCSTACAATLPSVPPSTKWNVKILTIGLTPATVGLSSLNFNGAAIAPTLTTGRVVNVATDGSNYFGDISSSGGLVSPLGWIDVTKSPYNVVCDGTTDNNPSTSGPLQTAINAAIAASQVLYIPATTTPCNYSTTLQLYGTTLIGGQLQSLTMIGTGGVASNFSTNPTWNSASVLQYTGTGTAASFYDGTHVANAPTVTHVAFRCGNAAGCTTGINATKIDSYYFMDVGLVPGSSWTTYNIPSGLASGTYTSGGTITGSSTQTCTLTSFNGSNVGGTATVALTGTNTIAGGTALTITAAGYGSTAASTTATLGSGTATCSGTATLTTVTAVSPAPYQFTTGWQMNGSSGGEIHRSNVLAANTAYDVQNSTHLWIDGPDLYQNLNCFYFRNGASRITISNSQNLESCDRVIVVDDSVGSGTKSYNDIQVVGNTMVFDPQGNFPTTNELIFNATSSGTSGILWFGEFHDNYASWGTNIATPFVTVMNGSAGAYGFVGVNNNNFTAPTTSVVSQTGTYSFNFTGNQNGGLNTAAIPPDQCLGQIAGFGNASCPWKVLGASGGLSKTESANGINLSGAANINANSTTHELAAATNGSANYGMLERVQPGPIHQPTQTAAISTATLCAASAGACNTAGQYHVHWDFIETGTACTVPGTGGVTFLLTWTDTNGTTHSAVSLGMDDASAINAVSQTFHFQSSLAAAWGSGDFNISTNGAVIQYATGYTACGTGTGQYQLDAVVTRVQ